MSLKDEVIGHDNILDFFLKVARHIITLYLLILIQFSFDHSIFPNNSKIARVVSIFKSGNRKDTTNYHPILILNCFSTRYLISLSTSVWTTLFGNIKLPIQINMESNNSTAYAMLDVVTAAYDNVHENL